MHSRFVGVISCDGSRPPRNPSGELPTIEFANGFLAHDAPSRVLADGGEICLSLGTPSFSDDRLEALAREAGPGAAWLAAFRAHGAEAPGLARGRFGVVVLDPAAGSAWMATDRFGTYPLCYAADEDALAFSDRANDVPQDNRTVDPQSLFDYVYFHVIPAPRTVFAGVQRLPAGTVLYWTRGRTQQSRCWQAAFDHSASVGFDDAKARFLELVRAGVEREADGIEVGAFLSGGTDSSTVSGMLTQVLGRPARTYSIGFDASGYDEMEYARIAARHFGTDHHEYYVTPDDLLEGIPKVAAHYDQPFGNSSAVPAWICATRAREDGVEKLLAGDGGDELFGGNTRYAKQRVFGAYDSVPRILRNAVIEPTLKLPGMGRMPLMRKGASYVEQARVPLPDRLGLYNLLLRLGPAQVFRPGFLAQVDQAAPLQQQRAVWAETAGEALINRMLAFDWKYTLADNDLPKVIGTTGLAGLEVGFPLLSDELLDFSLHLPPEWKLRKLTLRWFFKEALRGFLPDEIIAKKKHGFGLPFGVWACSHAGLQALAREALDGLKTRNIVDPKFIDALLDELLPAHPGYYGEMVWILLMLELWLREHAPDFRL